ncbi:MAG TPA: OmpA family protein [Crocinitomicaceae bacterium]|nr:OmpA family protein [Crocinitomicaceae bacterium]
MKKLILSVACVTSFAAISQNLVKNPEFNIAKKGSCGWTHIAKADGWSDANGGSVDIFNNKFKKASTGIPDNFMGTQASTGNYAGLIAYYADERVHLGQTLLNMEDMGEDSYQKYAEYLQGEITTALVAGQNYDFSFKVSLAENSARAVNGLGVYFSKERLAEKNNQAMSLTPQIKSSEMITDESGWTTVSGSFTATGGEKYFSIGAFAGSFTTKKTVVPMKENDSRRAYYYIYGPSLALGAARDADGDGVADEDDKCPTTTAGVAVDAMGCALDGDKDGVPDTNDKCLTTPKGVAVDASGCAIDTDGDGVADYKDKCPTVKGIVANEGCPKGEEPKDTDGDGVVDSMDDCPTVKGTVNGCPDRDGDGVADKDDLCPDTPGLKSLKGCVLNEDEVIALRKASKHIYFNSGSSVIMKKSYPDLDVIAGILKKHGEVKASIEGHTDSQGKDALNLKLSKSRAKSVKDYLISHGVKADHLSSQGYGETQPIADNKTSAGRAKNRRVIVKTTTYKIK